MIMEHRLDEHLDRLDREDEVWKELLPVGKLKTSFGEYYLVDTEYSIITTEDKQHPVGVIFFVIPKEPLGSTPDKQRYTYSSPRKLIVSANDTWQIEYGVFHHTILAFDGGKK